MGTNSIFFKITSLLTIFFFLHACSIYTLKEEPLKKKYDLSKKYIIVIHQKDFTAVLDNIGLSEESVSGNIRTYIKSEDPELLKTEYHLYISDDSNIIYSIGGQTVIPLCEIMRVENYKVDEGKVQLNIWSGLALMIGVAIIVFLIIGSNNDTSTN